MTSNDKITDINAISRGSLVALRIFQLICSVIVLGILAYLVHRVNEAGAHKEHWLVYGIVLAPISTAFSLVFMPPFMYSFLAFPADFAFWVMWLVLFCLLITVRYIAATRSVIASQLTLHIANRCPHMQLPLVQQLLGLLLGWAVR